jgi:hypothetical protein
MITKEGLEEIVNSEQLAGYCMPDVEKHEMATELLSYRWRDAKVELPEKEGMYLVVNVWELDTVIDTEFWTGDGWLYGNDITVTHWMPLPQLPEKE